MGIRVLAERCKGCELCVSLCPFGVLKLDDKVNKLGYYPAIAVKLDKCTNCRICELTCPDLAIYVTAEDEEG